MKSWLYVDEEAKRSGDVMLHLDLGHSGDNRNWLTVIGHWDGTKWVGGGLSDMRPSYWSPIPAVPDYLQKMEHDMQ